MPSSTWMRVNGRLWRTMDYPGVAESIASIERVAMKKEEMPKCDYCDKDGIYPQCRGRFVTCEEHILLPSKEEEGKDYHARDRRLYASDCEDEKEYHAADRFLDALEAQWKTMSCAGELNEDGIDLRDVPYLALTEKLSEVATPTEMDELDGWGDDPMSFYVMKCLADKYGLEYPKNPPSPPGRGEMEDEEDEEDEESEEAKAAWAKVWAETNAIIEAHSSGAMTTEEAAEASERMKKGEAMAKWMALIHTPR